MNFAAFASAKFATAFIWPQPLTPVHSLWTSALLAAVPLIVVLVLMGGLRKSGLFASTFGLASAAILALALWRMPPMLAAWSLAFAFVYTLWSILWLVFAALWLYNLSVATGSFGCLRRIGRTHRSVGGCYRTRHHEALRDGWQAASFPFFHPARLSCLDRRRREGIAKVLGCGAGNRRQLRDNAISSFEFLGTLRD